MARSRFVFIESAALWSALVASLGTAGIWAGIWFYSHSLATQIVPVKNLKATLLSSASHDLTLHIDGQNIIVKRAEISKWLETYTRTYSGNADMRISDRLTDYLTTLSQTAGKPAQDVRFIIVDGKVNIVTPAQIGSKLDVPAADQVIRRAILADITDVTLPIEPTLPAITEDTISRLNITQKLATGKSNFAGSTTARIQNIIVSSRIYNGLLIKPGEIFSFNKILGPVDAAAGYAPEKVIKNGKIEYEYGGGICQVSTTVFRAAVAAGFPIVERKPHAFPVHYYEPQGFDATIYPGESDLRFINDTTSYVLVQAHISGKDLYFDMYGTTDGRTVTVDGPHQYDIQPDGALKAYFVRTINFANGASKSQTFYSNYRSPDLYPTEPNPYL
jgi:vancomycin resistance protein YoaR